MKIKKIRDDLENYLKKHNLEKKYLKAKKLFENDPFYCSSTLVKTMHFQCKALASTNVLKVRMEI